MTSNQHYTASPTNAYLRDWFNELKHSRRFTNQRLHFTDIRIMTLSPLRYYGDENPKPNQTGHVLQMAYKRPRSPP